MRILNIGLDASALQGRSKLAQRLCEYAELVDAYIYLCPGTDTRLGLSPKALVIGVKAFFKPLTLLLLFFKANKLIKSEKVDVVSVPDQYYLGLMGYWAAALNGVGFELQVHGFEKFSGPRKLVSRFLIRRARAIRTVSQRLKKRLIEEFGAAEEGITVVSIHVDRTRQIVNRGMRNEQAEIGKEGHAFVFFSAGRLVAVKNFSLQIRAMSEVVKKHPNAELWIAGDGPDLEKLKLEIGKWKLENSVKLLGWQSDLGSLYSQADAFLLTSFAEGWPLVIMEAANFDLPIIMTDVGSAGELVIDGESGLVVPVDDVAALIEKMIELAGDRSLRERLVAGMKEKVKHLPSKRRILELYKISWEKAAKKAPKDNNQTFEEEKVKDN